MRKIRNNSIFAFVLFVLSSCVQETPESIPVVTILPITIINAYIVTTGGDVTSDGGLAITARGVCWSNKKNPTINDNITIDGAATGKFESRIEYLSPSEIYYIRAYATNPIGTAYSSESMLNLKSLLPVVNITTNLEITSTSVKLKSSIINDGGSTILQKGFCWAKTPSPDFSNDRMIDETEGNEITSTIPILEPLSTYYIRAYAINDIGISYGAELKITTLEPIFYSYKTILNYSSLGVVNEEVTYKKASNSNNWNNYSKTTFSYDANNHKTLSIYSDWDYTLNNWLNNRKESFSFFAFNEMWLGITYYWDSLNNNWKEYGKNEYTFSNNYNNVLYYSYYTYSSYKWTYYSKYMYTFSFDTQGRIIQSNIGEYRIGYADYNGNKGTSSIYYDSNGYLIGSSSGNNGTTLNITYDNNKNPIQKIYSKWDSNLGKYVEKSKTIYTYGSNGYLIEYIETVN